MEERARAIVLRVHPLTETSLIVHWLAAEQGRIATVAKGARRPKSPFRGALDLFYLCDLSFARSRKSDLHTLREARVVQPHSALRTELGWLRQAAYAAILIEGATERETPIPGVYALYEAFLAALPSHPPQPLLVFAFEMKLLRELGLAPRLEDSRLDPGSRQVLNRCLDLDFPALAALRLSAVQKIELQRFLHGFLVFHLERVPSGRAAALA